MSTVLAKGGSPHKLRPINLTEPQYDVLHRHSPRYWNCAPLGFANERRTRCGFQLFQDAHLESPTG